MPSTKDESEPEIALTAAQRVDRLCAEFERGWRADSPPAIEPLVDGLAGPERKAALRELLALELEYLQKRGTLPLGDDYRARFPDEADVVADAFREARIDLFATRPFDADAATRPLTGGAEATGTIPTRFGSYELIREIARGGMGVVYEARPVGSERRVALKMVLTDELATGEAVRRFRREAEAAAHLDHPHIVPIYEVGVAEGRHYFTMALVQGTTLAAELKKGPVDARRAARMVEQIADAVHYAHERGVVHRDLKPGNVLLERDGTARVMDFGLARRLGTASASADDVAESDEVADSHDAMRHADLTRTGVIMGTPAYMAPEQAIAARDAGPAADIYSLGVILYAMLTGRPPFLAANLGELIRQLLDSDPVSPREVNPAVSPALEAVCLKCLRKDPVERYATARELADDLRRFRADLPVLAAGQARSTPVTDFLKARPILIPLAAGLLVYHLSSFFEAVFAVCLLLGMRLPPRTESSRRGEAALLLVAGFAGGAILLTASLASWEFWNWGPASAVREPGSTTASPVPIVAAGGLAGLLIAWSAGRLRFLSREEPRRVRAYGWCVLTLAAGLLMLPAFSEIVRQVISSPGIAIKAFVVLWYLVPLLIVAFIVLSFVPSALDVPWASFLLMLASLAVSGVVIYGLYNRQPSTYTLTGWVNVLGETAVSFCTPVVWSLGVLVVGLSAGVALGDWLRATRRMDPAGLHAMVACGAGIGVTVAEIFLLALVLDTEPPWLGIANGNAIEFASRATGVAPGKAVPLFDWPSTLLVAAGVLAVSTFVGASIGQWVAMRSHARRKK